MTLSVVIVLVLFVLAVLNFIKEWMAVEVFSLLLIVTLVIFRVQTPRDAFMGFANSAIIMIAGVLILTGAIIHNGAADIIARRIQRLAGKSERTTAAFFFGAVTLVSSVINNVAATAMFIPVAEGMAQRFKVNRGNYLMHVAFASMLGGMCTLIGTSTNVAVSGALPQYGLEPMTLFELAPVGVVIALAGLVYLLVVAPRLLTLPGQDQGVETHRLREFLFEIVVHEGSALVGRTLEQTGVGRKLGINVLAIVRGGRRIASLRGSETIQAGDLLLVAGEARTIPEVMGAKGLEINKSIPLLKRADLESDKIKMVEATISYNSPFIGKTLKELNFRHQFDLNVVAIHRSEDVVLEKVGKIRLRAGDVLMIQGREEMFDRLGLEPTMVLIESAVVPTGNSTKALWSASIFLGAVISSASGWVDPPTGFLGGGALVIVLGCLSADEAYSYLNPRFLVMLAGMSSLGTAMESSGAARIVAQGLVSLIPASHPLILLAAFFLLTVGLTQPLNNAAAALLVLPIAIHAARDVGADPRSFAMAVTLAASCSFITPFEPACMLVFSTGRYRYGDFYKVGGLLTFLAFLISLVLVPLVWPL